MRWRVLEGALDAERLIDFFQRLIRDAGRKVFVILDDLTVNHAHIVKDRLAPRVKQTEDFYLPSYSPELNPDACLNADLKTVVPTQAPARTKGHPLDYAKRMIVA